MACAYYLARRGVRVTVLERDEIGRAASYGNAGSITPDHPPINKPGRVQQALKSLLHPLSPLYIAPSFDPALVRWLWRFSRTCTPRHLELSMHALAPLGRMSRHLFDELIDGEKLTCYFRREGYYEAYLTERGFESARHEAAMIARHGFQPEVVSGAALREREPAFNPVVVGGIFHPEAATINPYRFVLDLAECASRNGATFRTGTEVAGVRTSGRRVSGVTLRGGEVLEGDTVLLAGGAYSVPLLQALGIRFPLQAAKGYHLDCSPADGGPQILRHACVLGENMVFCTPMDGFVRFAGTLEFSGVNHQIRRPRLEQIIRASRRYLTTLDRVDARDEWCGLRPCLPDGLPAIGPVGRYDGLYVATGHAMMGVTFGPGTGKLMAECILDGSADIDLSAFRPDRF